jgi:7-cyano-7-deazaguanine synthase
MLCAMDRAVTILSGGLDSAVSTAMAIECGLRVVRAIFFDYGQKARAAERSASRSIARRYGIDWQAVGLPWLGEATKTALVGRAPPPRIREDQLDDLRRTRRTARAVWVPNRNGVFLNAAAAIAESIGARTLLTGFDREEASTFPDNSVAYISAVNRAFRYSTSNGVRVSSPVARMTKAEIVRSGLRLGAPFELFWSCYLGGPRPCGACESCRRSIRAYRAAGALDRWRGRA